MSGSHAMKKLCFAPNLLVLSLGILLAGCSNLATKTAQTPQETKTTSSVIPPFHGGGYYKDDGPGANPPANLGLIPSAVPRAEPLHRFANNTYRIRGRVYQPISDARDYRARGLASWYGRKFHGRPTSIGEPYDMYAMTAAHPTLPLPSYARVTNLENGRSVVVRLNDRGPFHDGRIIDLSYTAAYQLDVLRAPTMVEVEAVLPDDAPTSFTAQAEGGVALPVASLVETPTPPAPASAVTQRSASGVGHGAVFLQLGAFVNPDTAARLMERVTVKLSRDFPGVMRLEGDGLYRVQAGPFASESDADRAAAELRAEFDLHTFKVFSRADAPQPRGMAVAPPQVGAPALYLQFAAMSNSASAEALSVRVKQRLGVALPGISSVAADNLFKVQAGPFADAASAERVALAYQRDFGVKPFRVLR